MQIVKKAVSFKERMGPDIRPNNNNTDFKPSNYLHFHTIIPLNLFRPDTRVRVLRKLCRPSSDAAFRQKRRLIRVYSVCSQKCLCKMPRIKSKHLPDAPNTINEIIRIIRMNKANGQVLSSSEDCQYILVRRSSAA